MPEESMDGGPVLAPGPDTAVRRGSSSHAEKSVPVSAAPAPVAIPANEVQAPIAAAAETEPTRATEAEYVVPENAVNAVLEYQRRGEILNEAIRAQFGELHDGYDVWVKGLDSRMLRQVIKGRVEYTDGRVRTLRTGISVDSNGFERDFAVGYLTPKGEEFDPSQWDQLIIQPLTNPDYSIKYKGPTLLSHSNSLSDRANSDQWSMDYTSGVKNDGSAIIGSQSVALALDTYLVPIEGKDGFSREVQRVEVSEESRGAPPAQDVLTKAKSELQVLQGSKLVAPTAPAAPTISSPVAA